MTADKGEPGAPENDELRKQAVTRLKKQADFRVHLVIYLMVNAMLVVVWAMTNRDFFWPIFPIMGWGVGVVANAYDAYARLPSEARIEQEMNRLRDRR